MKEVWGEKYQLSMKPYLKMEIDVAKHYKVLLKQGPQLKIWRLKEFISVEGNIKSSLWRRNTWS